MTDEIFNGGELPEVTIMSDFKFDFEAGRKALFTRGYTELQTDSINAIIAQVNIQGIKSQAQAAYVFATAYHEAYDVKKGLRLVPIHELGGSSYLSKYDTGKLAKDLGNTPEADGDGQLYAGRGFSMITGKRNYEKFAKIMGLNLLKYPDLVMEVDNAAFILVYGMIHGSFTGKKLSDYITKNETDFVNSRKIINGTDKAAQIGKYALQFMDCVK